jgi:hypothetical protein
VFSVTIKIYSAVKKYRIRGKLNYVQNAGNNFQNRTLAARSIGIVSARGVMGCEIESPRDLGW